MIPATSLTLPLLGRYLLFSMVLVAVSVCLATIVLNLHYRKPSTHRMPVWVRNVLIQKMPGILFMRVPKQVGRPALLGVEGFLAGGAGGPRVPPQ